ncbi:MAG: alpha/beta hydrolase [Flavobacteriaceae bacterium]
MQKRKAHVYFIPGMAANTKIFEYIKLPQDSYELHYIEWEIPCKNESLSAYVQRMVLKIKHDNPILFGVSFGGIVVQEMSKYLKAQKIVVVSSVVHQQEFPVRMRFAKLTRAYKLVPTQLFSDIEKLAKYAFGETATHRVDLYKKYMSIHDKNYLDWAIEQLINWKQTQQLDNVIHIHGSHDKIFPIKYIKGNVVKVNNGTHVMIINKYKWFNENLPKLLTA